MSSFSGVEKHAAAAGARGWFAQPTWLRQTFDRWFLFADHGAAAQCQMAIVWSCAFTCMLADVIWLPSSHLSFADSNWSMLIHWAIYGAFAAAFLTFAARRLADDPRLVGVALRWLLQVGELLWRGLLPIAALLIAGSTLSYVITAESLPLHDESLAQVDHLLGFDWPSFLRATNASPLIAQLLTEAYNAIGLITKIVLVALVLGRRGDRLVELMAVLSLSTVALCFCMWLVPAAGAFAYFKPAQDLYGNFARLGEMWSFSHTYNALRDGTLSVVDITKADGIVSFPSFHTMLGIMTAYAIRDTRWLAVPVIAVNATMILATMPVGGHHLADVIAGGGLTVGAILLVRRSARGRAEAR